MKKKAIFWDLLGTLGGESHTLISQGFSFFEEAIPALKLAQSHGYLNLIITNQSQIAHGRMTIEDYQRALEGLLEQLSKAQAEVTAVYTCPHRREDGCHCKKPQAFFVEAALLQHELDREQCYIVGDSVTNDFGLAQNAQMKSVLVRTGEEQVEIWLQTPSMQLASDCLAAIESIVAK
ncbi:HAD-IIIA family hydrolase [Enterococcus sp. LJL98]